MNGQGCLTHSSLLILDRDNHFFCFYDDAQSQNIVFTEICISLFTETRRNVFNDLCISVNNTRTGFTLITVRLGGAFIKVRYGLMDGVRRSVDSVFVPDPDSQVMKRLDVMLETAHPKLVGLDGEEIPLPDSVYQILRQVTQMMAAGQVISLVPHDHYLSCQEAADLLNVSRPYLYTLLDQGVLAFIKVGTHRRIRFEDLMVYKQQRDRDRRQALSELAAMSQEAGFYSESGIAGDNEL